MALHYAFYDIKPQTAAVGFRGSHVSTPEEFPEDGFLIFFGNPESRVLHRNPCGISLGKDLKRHRNFPLLRIVFHRVLDEIRACRAELTLVY